ncbi:MAG: sugar phosphate isomerase/epimerase, partial [Clostridia bacterium]|nr:sugar phosphate isomerase/epimerase [Clostridia bacterium]
AEKRIGELVGLGGEENLCEAERRFLVNCRVAERLGADTMVLHLWNGLPSDFAFPRHLEAYDSFARLAREHGLTLTVENVVCAAGDPLSHFLALAERYPDVAFTYDTKMAAFHRQETALFEPPYSGVIFPRVRHIHFNDYGGVPGDFSRLAVLHLGEGYLDLAGIARHLIDLGYGGTVTLECSCMCPDGSLLPERMNASLAMARRLFASEAEGETPCE